METEVTDEELAGLLDRVGVKGGHVAPLHAGQLEQEPPVDPSVGPYDPLWAEEEWGRAWEGVRDESGGGPPPRDRSPPRRDRSPPRRDRSPPPAERPTPLHINERRDSVREVIKEERRRERPNNDGPDTNALLDRWVAAKKARDYKTSDELREQLRRMKPPIAYPQALMAAL